MVEYVVYTSSSGTSKPKFKDNKSSTKFLGRWLVRLAICLGFFKLPLIFED